MSQTEEKFAIRIRDCGERIAAAHRGLAKAKADLERQVARSMVASMEKTSAAQARYADDCELVYQCRLAVGAAEGELAASRAELEAVKCAFETWRTKMANLRLERKAYGNGV